MARTRIETDSFGAAATSPADRYWGAQTAAHRSATSASAARRMPTPLIRALGHRQEGGGAGQPGARRWTSQARRADRRCRPGSDRRQARRALPAGRLADRVRHPDQHERQRGHRQPRHRDAGRRSWDRRSRSIPTTTSTARNPPTTPSRRPCTSPPPTRSAAACMPGTATGSTRRSTRKVSGLGEDHQDRPHPSAGRDAADARPGILRLRGAGRASASSG